jgi:SAP domain-containing ribonucleoprotein
MSSSAHSLTILHPISSNSLTVPKLKELLTAKNLPTTGKKADLIQRLEENGVAAEATETVNEPHADTTVRCRYGVCSRQIPHSELNCPNGSSLSSQKPTESTVTTTSATDPNLAVTSLDPGTTSAPVSTAATTTAPADLAPDLPPDLQAEYDRRLARAAKFGLPLSEVQIPTVASSSKPTAAAAAASTTNGSKAKDASSAAPAQAKSKKEPVAPAPAIDEETLKRRREKFGIVEKEEEQGKNKKSKAAAGGVDDKAAKELKGKTEEKQAVIDP